MKNIRSSFLPVPLYVYKERIQGHKLKIYLLTIHTARLQQQQQQCRTPCSVVPSGNNLKTSLGFSIMSSKLK